MSDKFHNKYRIPSARASWWDYTNAGVYFITICTKNQVHYFGEINNGKMELSSIGLIANRCWQEIINHTENAALGEFVVMPNHIHGILILNRNNGVANVETLHATSLRMPDSPRIENVFMAKISPKPNSVSTIIRSYKSAITKHAHDLGALRQIGWC
jgi:putative transposase